MEEKINKIEKEILQLKEYKEIILLYKRFQVIKKIDETVYGKKEDAVIEKPKVKVLTR